VAPPETNTAWVIDGYALSTHPDLCDRVKEINELAGEPAEFGFLYGKPVLVGLDGRIVAFGGGTHVFCVQVARDEVDARLLVEREQPEGLPTDEWTRVDPWTVEIPKAEGLQQLAALVRRAAGV
jgi:hypothetical protein